MSVEHFLLENYIYRLEVGKTLTRYQRPFYFLSDFVRQTISGRVVDSSRYSCTYNLLLF